MSSTAIAQRNRPGYQNEMFPDDVPYVICNAPVGYQSSGRRVDFNNTYQTPSTTTSHAYADIYDII